jgi:hypothetical protein
MRKGRWIGHTLRKRQQKTETWKKDFFEETGKCGKPRNKVKRLVGNRVRCKLFKKALCS